MKRTQVLGIVLFGALLALPWNGIYAGGWASVEIVNAPETLQANEPVTLELVVKQHGISPVDIDPLIISVTNAETGESIEETASKAAGAGNYTVALSLPSDGTWDMTATPGDFPAFDMGSVRVGQTSGDRSILAPAGAVVITIAGGMGSGQFEPNRIEIGKGTLVVWQNDSTEGHTVVLNNDPRRSGLIGPGGAYALRFDEPGTYQVSCGPHPAMSATIVVH